MLLGSLATEKNLDLAYLILMGQENFLSYGYSKTDTSEGGGVAATKEGVLEQ